MNDEVGLYRFEEFSTKTNSMDFFCEAKKYSIVLRIKIIE